MNEAPRGALFVWVVGTLLCYHIVNTEGSAMIITLFPGVPVDLYSTTGISVGTQLHLQNITGTRIRVAVDAAELATSYNIVEGSAPWVNKMGDTGAWAICNTGHCDINVRAV